MLKGWLFSLVSGSDIFTRIFPIYLAEIFLPKHNNHVFSSSYLISVLQVAFSKRDIDKQFVEKLYVGSSVLYICYSIIYLGQIYAYLGQTNGFYLGQINGRPEETV